MKSATGRSGSWEQGVAVIRLCLVVLTVCGLCIAQGQQQTGAEAAATAAAAPSELVTINVDDGPITQVLNAFSLQTRKSIVLGPDVKGNVTVRLSNIRWEDALDAILRPYGYGYYTVGDTVIVTTVAKLPKPEAVQAAAAPPEPLVVKVFNLKYLDASDVEDLIKAQLTPGRGTVSRLLIRSQTWEAERGYAKGTEEKGASSAESLGRLLRTQEESKVVRVKTIVVVDTEAVIAGIAKTLEQVDQMPDQVLIEARFVEVRNGLLRDIGFEFGTGAQGVESPGVQTIRSAGGGNLYGIGAEQVSGEARPLNFPGANDTSVSPLRPFNAGLSFAFEKLTDTQFQILLHALEEDASYNILSSPRILTINNQDATIVVGQKYPIIKSDTTAGTTATTATSLDYYMNIGIQLKVLPQICDGGFINLIVHPSVKEQVGTAQGVVVTGTSVPLTAYPVLTTREAETQILLKSGQTIVIGGLLKDKKSTAVIKVPFLGNIPLLGMLFRRQTASNEKIDLLIFLTATIRSPEELEKEAAETAGEQKPN